MAAALGSSSSGLAVVVESRQGVPVVAVVADVPRRVAPGVERECRPRLVESSPRRHARASRPTPSIKSDEGSPGIMALSTIIVPVALAKGGGTPWGPPSNRMRCRQLLCCGWDSTSESVGERSRRRSLVGSSTSRTPDDQSQQDAC